MPAEIAGARSAEQFPFAHFANTTINSLVSYLRGAVKIYTYNPSILKRFQEVIMKKSAKLLSAVMAGAMVLPWQAAALPAILQRQLLLPLRQQPLLLILPLLKARKRLQTQTQP